MSDILKDLASKNSNEEALRKCAAELGTLFGAKPAKNKRIVIGEGYAPFKIPLHTDEFFCFVAPSETTYSFTAECRKKKAEVADFAVNLVNQVGFTAHCPSISESLGVPVYGNRLFTEEEIAAKLLTPRLTALLRRVDFAPISHCLLSPIQFHVRSAFQGVERCADQSRLFRELITSVYQEAFERARHAKG